MDKIGTKTLKIILFIGVFAYLLYSDYGRTGAMTLDAITGGLMMASAAYLLASLFGLVLYLSRNYLIAIIGTGALALFLAFKLDEIVASTAWLSEGLAAAILGALALLCLVCDILIVKTALAPPRAVKEGIQTAGTPVRDDNITMQSNMKSDPQSVFNISNMLETKWGRKPTYDEVMGYIDHLVIPEDK